MGPSNRRNKKNIFPHSHLREQSRFQKSIKETKSGRESSFTLCYPSKPRKHPLHPNGPLPHFWRPSMPLQLVLYIGTYRQLGKCSSQLQRLGSRFASFPSTGHDTPYRVPTRQHLTSPSLVTTGGSPSPRIWKSRQLHWWPSLLWSRPESGPQEKTCSNHLPCNPHNQQRNLRFWTLPERVSASPEQAGSRRRPRQVLDNLRLALRHKTATCFFAWS